MFLGSYLWSMGPNSYSPDPSVCVIKIPETRCFTITD